ncbi:hypothetical protein JMJ77_0014593, partial [Colletotrichum scovillei]
MVDQKVRTEYCEQVIDGALSGTGIKERTQSRQTLAGPLSRVKKGGRQE